jgi:hypothetical protein
MNFALSEEQFSDPEIRDLNNEKFWQKLSETFQVTLEMLREIVQREGIDLDSIDMERTAEEEKFYDEAAENHESCRAAKVYAEMVDGWFDSATDLFEKKGDELSMKVRLELPDVNPEKEADDLKDAVEIIHWYQYQIYVKLMMAIRGKLKKDLVIDDESPNNSDGSAKVALIGMDRSIAAWGEMRNIFPRQEDTILDLLLHLDRLRRNVEKVFPKARSFVRPGFDE